MNNQVQKLFFFIIYVRGCNAREDLAGEARVVVSGESIRENRIARIEGDLFARGVLTIGYGHRFKAHGARLKKTGKNIKIRTQRTCFFYLLHMEKL